MKFAIIRRNGLGDFISATIPVCNYIKDNYQNSEFLLFLSKQNSSLVKYFFPNAFVYTFGSGNKYFETIKAALKFRHLAPEIGIAPTPTYNKLNGTFLKLLGAANIYGIRGTRSFADRFFTKLLVSSMEDHVALQNIKIFDPSIERVPQKYCPRINKNIIKDCKIKLPSSKIILVEVSSHRQTSQLTNENLARVLNSASKCSDFSVVISLVEKDMEKALSLQKALHIPSMIALSPTLDDLISLINQVDIFLLGDGGMAHIAGALDKPGVAVYGETSIKRWAVLSDKVTHLYDKEDVNNIDLNLITKSLLEKLW